MVSLVQLVGQVREPLRSYSWVIDLPKDFGDSQRLRYQVKSVDLPVWVGMSVSDVIVGGQGRLIIPNEFEEVGEVVVSFWESVDLVVQKYFWNWRKVMVGEGISGLPYRELKAVPSKWMKDVVVALLDGKGKEVVRYRLKMCYPVKVEDVKLSYEENGVVEVNVSFAVCDIQVEGV